MPLVPGAQFGPYRIVSQLGQGGMATVYKAFQPSLGRHVALKVLPEFFADQPGFKQRFQQEAMAVARLRHSNIPVVFDYGEENGVAYIVSEYLGGGDLTTKIGSTPLLISEAVAWLLPVASALDYAHSQGVLHRDLKPSNILLSDNGTPFLSDFGLAKMMGGESEKLTATGMVLGTPEYMSPEQCLGGEITGAADLYSLGVIAFEMLTSRVPFSAPTPAAVIVAQLQAPLPLPTSLNPELPIEVEGVLLKGLAKDPNDRYPSASEFVAALAAGDRAAAVVRETISSPPVSVERAAVAVVDPTPAAAGRVEPPPPRGQRAGRPSRRRTYTVVAVLAIAVLMIAGGIGVLSYINRPVIPALGSIDCVLAPVKSDEPICYAAGSQGAISSSFSGGSSWTDFSPNGTQFLGPVSCVDINYCAVGTGSAAVLVTQDSSTWNRHDTGISGRVNALACIHTALEARALCVAVGNSNLIGVSADGGVTWNARPVAGAPSTLHLAAVACPTTSISTCYAVGDDGSTKSPYANKAEWVVSRDAGSSWTASDATGLTGTYFDADRTLACPTVSVCIAMPRVGALGSNKLAVLKTSDGGATWTRTDWQADGGGQVSCPSDTVCYAAAPAALGSTIGIFVSDGSLLNWTQQWSSPKVYPYSISCVDAARCVAVAGDFRFNGSTWKTDVVLRTTDGGKTWKWST